MASAGLAAPVILLPRRSQAFIAELFIAGFVLGAGGYFYFQIRKLAKRKLDKQPPTVPPDGSSTNPPTMPPRTNAPPSNAGHSQGSLVTDGVMVQDISEAGYTLADRSPVQAYTTFSVQSSDDLQAWTEEASVEVWAGSIAATARINGDLQWVVDKSQLYIDLSNSDRRAYRMVSANDYTIAPSRD